MLFISTCTMEGVTSLLLLEECCLYKSCKSKQNAVLSEQQQGYLLQMDVVNFAQIPPQQVHARLVNYTSTSISRK